MIADLKARCDTIEECYEFMLAYAAQGLPSDLGSPTGLQLRSVLTRLDEALTDAGGLFRRIVEGQALQPADTYQAFIDVLERDARDAQAAVRLVLIQKDISSQLVDNLNATIHLRALLTDLFLLDEIIRPQREG